MSVVLTDLVGPSAYSGAVTWTPAGGVETDLDEVLDWQEVDVFQFMTDAQRADVQAGTLLYDAKPAFASALATGRPVRAQAGSGWKYLFESTLTIPTGATLRSSGARIQLAAAVDNHVMAITPGADDVLIEGFNIHGVKASNTGGHGISLSLAGAGGTNITIRGCVVHDCSSAGIYLAGTLVEGVDITGCRVYANYSGGITTDSTVTEFSFSNNFAWDNGTHGIGILGIATDGVIDGNVCWDNGQGSPTADNLTGYNVANTNIVVSNNTSKGGGNNGIHFGGERISYIGNIVTGATQHGILHSASTGRSKNLVMASNSSKSNGLSGALIVDTDGGTVTGNICSHNTERGIYIDTLTNFAFGDNVVTNNTLEGMRNFDASNNLTIAGLVSHSNGGDGLDLAEVTASVISACNIYGNTGYGIQTGGTEGTNVISNCKVLTNTAGQIASMAATTVLTNNDVGAGPISTYQQSPLFYGGSTTTSTITYKTTTGVGTTGADHIFLTGSNGATEAMRIINSGKVGVGIAVPLAQLNVCVPSGTDAFRLSNSSASNRGYMFYPVTSGADSDMRMYEYAASGSGDRVIFKAGGIVQFKVGTSLVALVDSVTAPTVSGFGTSPSVVAHNGTAAFTINVGTGGTADTGTITLPTAANGWVLVACENVSNPASFVVGQTGGTATTITLQNYSRTTGLAIAWTASDILRCSARAY